MDNKLERFFNKIEFLDIEDFIKSKVTKVTINKNDESWTVYIENNEYIKTEYLYKLIEIRKKGIDGVSTINIVYDNKNLTSENILDYFKYVLNEFTIMLFGTSSNYTKDLLYKNIKVERNKKYKIKYDDLLLQELLFNYCNKLNECLDKQPNLDNGKKIKIEKILYLLKNDPKRFIKRVIKK